MTDELMERLKAKTCGCLAEIEAAGLTIVPKETARCGRRKTGLGIGLICIKPQGHTGQCSFAGGRG